eukprot:5833033-Pleurochrysis_carterae.AAC.1
MRFSTTEFQHIPELRVPGFWGTFVPRPIPGYDPKDPRKGSQCCLRHHSVGRERIELYAVDTFTDKIAVDNVERAKTVVRECRSSLERLAAVVPDMAMPSTIPPTHNDNRATSRPQQQQRGRGGSGGAAGGGRWRQSASATTAVAA